MPAVAPRTALVVLAALLAFAANSILCRMALRFTAIDAATFTTVRLVSGALTLALLVVLRRAKPWAEGNWLSATALFAYAAGFSFAYRGVSAATGALLLFGAVQVTMIGAGLRRGERLTALQLAGVVGAVAGLIALLLPGLTAPPLVESCLMLAAGLAWGIYSLRGRGAVDAIAVTAGNFLRSVPLTCALGGVAISSATWDASGFLYAAASGALASGVGYVLWYSALSHLSATQAATLQLCVPILATIGGVIFLGEALTARVVIASAAVLGGVFLAVRRPPIRARG